MLPAELAHTWAGVGVIGAVTPVQLATLKQTVTSWRAGDPLFVVARYAVYFR